MAQFPLTIPDELLPALVVEFGIVSAAGGLPYVGPVSEENGTMGTGE